MSGTLPPPFHPRIAIHELGLRESSPETNVALGPEWQAEEGHYQHQSGDDKSDPATSVLNSDTTTIRRGASAQGVPDQGGPDSGSEKSTLTNDSTKSKTSKKRKRDYTGEAEEYDTQSQRRCHGSGASAEEHGELEASHIKT